MGPFHAKNFAIAWFIMMNHNPLFAWWWRELEKVHEDAMRSVPRP